MKRVLIAGIASQVGGYLADWLLDQGHEVFGLTKPGSGSTLTQLPDRTNKIRMLDGDLFDEQSVSGLIAEARPDEVYNLTAEPSESDDRQARAQAADNAAVAGLQLLSALASQAPTARFFQAGAREMSGRNAEFPPPKTSSALSSTSFGTARWIFHAMARHYRETHGLFVCSGILWDHTSPRTAQDCVSRKIAGAVARIALGLDQELRLDSLSHQREWGFAADYARAVWLTLQAPQPDDYVIATGHAYSVLNFVELAFDHVGLNWRDFVVTDADDQCASFEPLLGDATKAGAQLGWEPQVTFCELVKIMVSTEIEEVRRMLRARYRQAA